MKRTNKLKISLVPDVATGRYSVSDSLIESDTLLKEVELLPSALAELMKKVIDDEEQLNQIRKAVKMFGSENIEIHK